MHTRNHEPLQIGRIYSIFPVLRAGRAEHIPYLHRVKAMPRQSIPPRTAMLACLRSGHLFPGMVGTVCTKQELERRLSPSCLLSLGWDWSKRGGGERTLVVVAKQLDYKILCGKNNTGRAKKRGKRVKGDQRRSQPLS